MNLVQTAALARKIITLIAALIILYIVAWISSPIIKGGFYALFPPKDVPNVLYGKLEPLQFVEKRVLSDNPGYVLNTANGRLPNDFPKKIPVYKFKDPEFSYSAGKDAQAHALFLGFSDDELITDLKGSIYKWRDKTSLGTLEINTTTRELILGTSLSGKSSFFTEGTVTKSNAITWAKAMLQAVNRLEDPLYMEGSQEALLGKIQVNQVVETQIPGEAEVARVDFFRELNSIPLLGPDPKKGLISVILREPNKESDAFNYPIIDIHEWELVPTTDNTQATYPLISVSEAWNAVAERNAGVIANVTPLGASLFTPYVEARIDQVLIEEVYLAYYDTPERQKYLQPIYVFEGKYNVSNRPGGSIVIYFPALQGQYINTPQPTNTQEESN